MKPSSLKRVLFFALLVSFGLHTSLYAGTYTDKTAFESALIDIMTVDFEGIAGGPGQTNAVDINGDEFPGLTLSEGPGASGLFVGIPDNPIQPDGDNDNNFFAADFIPTSPDACLAPDLTGSPVGAVIVNFDNPVGGVGVYFLDVELGGASIEVFDGPGGTGNSLGILSLGNQGDNSQAFAGVVASGNNIKSVVLNMGGGGDGVGIDDLSFGLIRVVDIDIKPGSYPNSINPNASGVIPVAILTTDIFDAHTVDPETVALEGASARSKGKSGRYGSMEDVDGDGDLDLVVQVVNEINWAENTTEATLTGNLKAEYGGIPIVGSDSVNIVPPG